MKIRTTAKAIKERMTRRYEPGELEIVPIDILLYCVMDTTKNTAVYYGTQERCRSWATYHTSS